MVIKWQNSRRRYNIGKLNFFVRNEKLDICSNTCFTLFLKLHWTYFCQLAKLNYRFWCTRTAIIKLYFVNLFCKLFWKVSMPSYAPEVRDYGKAQTGLINRAVDPFDWVNLFLDKIINEQVILFNRTILNIFHIL